MNKHDEIKIGYLKLFTAIFGHVLLNKILDDLLETITEREKKLIRLRFGLDDLLETITEREKKLIRLRFGLDDGYRCTLNEAASAFNVTTERIRQIEAKALRKMRYIFRRKHILKLDIARDDCGE